MKNSENKMLDQLLKDQLAEGSAKVPDFVWDKIEEELFPEKKRRGFFWWFFGGIGVLLLGGSALFFYGKASGSQRFDQKQYAHHNTPVQNNADAKLNIYRKAVVPTLSKQGRDRSGSQDQIASHQSIDHSSVNVSSTKAVSASVSKTSSKQKAILSSKNSATSGKNTTGKSSADSPETKNVAFSNTQAIPDQTNTGKETTEPEKTPGITDKTTGTEADSVNYAQILEMLQKRYPFSDEPKELSRFSIGIYGGPSFYDVAVFKDYFTSGQLSNRTFTSSGFEAGFNARFKLGNRFTIYSGLAFNQKQSQFRYNVAITQADYFTNVVNGNKIPLANIVDNGVNSCFLAKDVTSKYSISSTLLSLGTTYEFWRSGKFSAAADLRFSFNLQTAMRLSEMTVIDIPQPETERFSYFQPGLGVMLNVQLNKRLSVGLSPLFSKQFYTKESFTKKANELVVPVTMSFRF